MRQLALIAAVLLATGCNRGEDQVSDTLAGAISPADSLADTTGTPRDTSASRGTSGDASAAATAGTSRGTSGSVTNQTQSGVTNARTGQSTLGPGVKRLEPTGGQPTVNREPGVPAPSRDTARRPPR
jgi:hypothetical protein